MTIYLNMKTTEGVETVDEFTQEVNQTYRGFIQYVIDMVGEYHTSGMSVYRSQRCTKDWND